VGSSKCSRPANTPRPRWPLGWCLGWHCWQRCTRRSHVRRRQGRPAAQAMPGITPHSPTARSQTSRPARRCSGCPAPAASGGSPCLSQPCMRRPRLCAALPWASQERESMCTRVHRLGAKCTALEGTHLQNLPDSSGASRLVRGLDLIKQLAEHARLKHLQACDSACRLALQLPGMREQVWAGK